MKYFCICSLFLAALLFPTNKVMARSPVPVDFLYWNVEEDRPLDKEEGFEYSVSIFELAVRERISECDGLSGLHFRERSVPKSMATRLGRFIRSSKSRPNYAECIRLQRPETQRVIFYVVPEPLPLYCIGGTFLLAPLFGGPTSELVDVGFVALDAEGRIGHQANYNFPKSRFLFFNTISESDYRIAVSVMLEE